MNSEWTFAREVNFGRSLLFTNAEGFQTIALKTNLENNPELADKLGWNAQLGVPKQSTTAQPLDFSGPTPAPAPTAPEATAAAEVAGIGQSESGGSNGTGGGYSRYRPQTPSGGRYPEFPPTASNSNTQTTRGSGLISSPAPADLAINSSTESRPVPIVFGTAKIPGNYLRYDNNQFRANPITQRDQLESGERYNRIVGYNYTLTWDLALCAGPIDFINDVTIDENTKILQTQIDFSAGNRQAAVFDDRGRFNVNRIKRDNFIGNVVLYGGASDQARGGETYDNGVDYQSTAFVHFSNFNLADRQSPPTVQFDVTRIPRCFDAAGDALTSFPTRGSDNSGHPSYGDANPAAAIWEILTNANWGAAVPHAHLDEDSFRTAATYFAENDIGLSFVLASTQNLDTLIQNVSDSASTLLVWTGQLLKLSVLTNLTTAYASRVRLDEEQINNVNIDRGSWAATYNELRLGFKNRLNGHESESVLVQDLASINALGRVQSMSIETNYSNRETAEIQARRMLHEVAYPKASITFEMNRYASGMEPGAMIEFVDRSRGDATTTYWRILSITDTDGSIRVKGQEDFLAVGFRGEDSVFETVGAPYLAGEILTPAEVFLGDDNNAEDIGTFGPGACVELPATKTGGVQLALMAIQRADTVTANASLTWELETAGTAVDLPDMAPWALIGELDADVAITNHTDRVLTIDVLMDTQAHVDTIVAAVQTIDATSDDFASLTQTDIFVLAIGKELMRVGKATDQTGLVVRFTGIIRGDMGTNIAAYTASTEVVFFEEIGAEHYLSKASITDGASIEFNATQTTTRGTAGGTATFTKTFTGRAQQPDPPTLTGTPVDTAGDWTMEMRPRLITRGAGTGASLEAEATDLFTDLPTDLAYRVDALNVSNTILGTATLSARFETAPAYVPAEVGITAYRFIPDTGLAGSCIIEIEATPDVTATKFRIYSIVAGIQSLTYLEIEP